MLKINRCFLMSVSVCLSLILSGCGGGGSSEDVVNVSSAAKMEPKDTPHLTRLVDVVVADDFDWETHLEIATEIQLVSNLSFIGDDQLPILGRRLLVVYGVDEHGMTLSQPVFKGMTNMDGSIHLSLSLPSRWQAIDIHADVPSVACTTHIDPQYLAAHHKMGCDLLVLAD